VAKAITVVLADHHVVLTDGLRVILDAEDDLAVLAVAHDDGQAVTSAARHRPTVLVLDAQLPVGRLDQTLAAVRAASPTTRLLVLSGASDPEMTPTVLACGADGLPPRTAPAGRWQPSSASSRSTSSRSYSGPSRPGRAATPWSSCACRPCPAASASSLS
jgi:CheY-like chemotaxis protein